MGIICTIVLVLMGYSALGVVGGLLALLTVVVGITICETTLGKKVLKFFFEDVDND